MDKKITQILGINKSKETVNTDTYLNVQLNGSQRLLPPDEINKVLDLGEQFNKERQSCTQYRVLGKLNQLTTNVLFNITGNDYTWEALNTALFTNNSDPQSDVETLTYAESIKKHLKEIDGWWGYFNPILTGSGLCNFFDMEPKRERFSFVPDITNIQDTLIDNWSLTITYPYSSDKTHNMIAGGVLIVDKASVIVGGKEMIAIGVPVRHNLINGDTVRLIGTNLNGDYEVKRIGLDNGNLKEYYFCIDLKFNDLFIDENSRMNKIYNNVTSEYYFRKFKKIKTNSSQIIERDDYEIYKLGFSENIFSDDITQFVFNEDINIEGLRDNLNRPLSEMFLTILKTDSNGIFTQVSSGIEVPEIANLKTGNINQYLRNVPIVQKIHNVFSSLIQSPTPLESNITSNNLEYYGDVVEYNPTTVEEVVLADVQHRFNTVNRETTGNQITSGPRPEGYYYPAHHTIKLRNFSSYIEEGDEATAGIPDYSVNLGDGRFIWRDLLNIGTSDINREFINYPFVNGKHYMYKNYCFNIKRQDPFDFWDLYHSSFPADPIGNTVNNKFKVNIADDAC